jgi:hypothetical protein
MDNFYKSGAIEGLKKALEEHNPWGVAWRAFPAFVELAVKPILEHVVPRQKMGVFFDHARLEIEKLGQNPDPADVRARWPSSGIRSITAWASSSTTTCSGTRSGRIWRWRRFELSAGTLERSAKSAAAWPRFTTQLQAVEAGRRSVHDENELRRRAADLRRHDGRDLQLSGDGRATEGAQGLLTIRAPAAWAPTAIRSASRSRAT